MLLRSFVRLHRTSVQMKGTLIMKRNWLTALPIAGALLLFPSITPAQTLASDTPNVVELTHALDAKKLTSGATIQTRLTHPIRLANGTKLPTGTWLNASVAEDDM